MAKEAEQRLVDMANYFGWYRHKYGDVRYCIHCQEPLPKTERMPDYALAPLYTWIECKNNDSTGRWRWAEIGPDGERHNQRNWLMKHGGWLLIELGEGRAPNEKSAWLIPFAKWVSDIEPVLIEEGMKSVRRKTLRGRPGALELFEGYEMLWITNHGWVPKNGHVFWKVLKREAQHIVELAETKEKGI